MSNEDIKNNKIKKALLSSILLIFLGLMAFLFGGITSWPGFSAFSLLIIVIGVTVFLNIIIKDKNHHSYSTKHL